MKYLKKPNVNIVIPSFILTLIFSVVIAFNAFAMGISISFADVNATVGDEVNLVMTAFWILSEEQMHRVGQEV